MALRSLSRHGNGIATLRNAKQRQGGDQPCFAGRGYCTSEQRTATARQGYASDINRYATGLHRSDMGSKATAKRGGANQGMATRRLRRELQRRCFGLLGAAWQRSGTVLPGTGLRGTA